MAATVAAPLLVNGLQPLSCLRCAYRKVRCDRITPCSNCIKHNVLCEFPPPKTEKRRKRKTPAAQSTVSSRSEIHEANSGIDVEHVSEISRLISKDFPERVVTPRQNALVSAAIFEERQSHDMQEIRVAENSDTCAVVLDTITARGGGSEIRSTVSALAFGSMIRERDIGRSYPTQQQFSTLWETFLCNVHPVTMILHGPSTGEALFEAIRHPGNTSKETEALLFAVLACASESMSDVDCLQRLGETKTKLVSTFQSRCESALIDVKFLMSHNLIVLQAFAIYLLAVGSSIDPKELWNLIGIVKRNAQTLTLHNKHVASLSPFEEEMWRRLWYHVALMDTTTLQLAGLHQIESLPPIKPPSNVNDSDLSPNMAEPAREHVTATDMFFCNLQHRLMNFRSKKGVEGYSQKQSVDTADQAHMIQNQGVVNEFEKEIEMNFLRYCDTLNPAHFLGAVVARSTLCGLRFTQSTEYDTFKDITTERREHKFAMALKVLEYENSEHSQQLIQGFAWQAHQRVQWSCFVFLLEDLKARPYSNHVNKAWEQIQLAYEFRPALHRDKGLSVHYHPAINELIVEAWQVREVYAVRCGQFISTPLFIKKLREQQQHRLEPRHGTLYASSPLLISASDPIFDAVPHSNNQEVNDWLDWSTIDMASPNGSEVITSSSANRTFFQDSDLGNHTWDTFASVS